MLPRPPISSASVQVGIGGVIADKPGGRLTTVVLTSLRSDLVVVGEIECRIEVLMGAGLICRGSEWKLPGMISNGFSLGIAKALAGNNADDEKGTENKAPTGGWYGDHSHHNGPTSRCLDINALFPTICGRPPKPKGVHW